MTMELLKISMKTDVMDGQSVSQSVKKNLSGECKSSNSDIREMIEKMHWNLPTSLLRQACMHNHSKFAYVLHMCILH